MNPFAKTLVRASHLFLAFTSSAVVWILCVAAPILIGTVVSFVPVILMAIWASIARAPVPGTAIEMGVVVIILLVTAALVPSMSTAILRLSLRLSPLPIGIPVRSHFAPTLWLSWVLVAGALAASDSEWISILVAVLIGASGMGRAWHFRYHWKGYPRGRTVLFLRRFGRTADRLVSTAIRRAVPEGTSLAFLVGARQGAASWDPLVVGWSAAMDTELGIVEACGATDRLIVLLRHSDPAESALHAFHKLRYRASWRQAGHRMFWGFMLTLVPAVVGESLGWSLQSRFLVTLPAVVAWLCLAVRPLMDPDSADELTRSLAALGRPI